MKRFFCNPVTQIVSAPSGAFSEQAPSPPGGDESIPHFQFSPSAKLYWNSAMAPEGVFMQAMSLFIDLSSVMQGTYSAAPTCGCEHDGRCWIGWSGWCTTVACVKAASQHQIYSERWVHVCVLHLPAVADLPRWVTEMVRWFGPVRRTGSTNPPMGPVGMVRCQRMDFWNVCEIWIPYVWAYQHLANDVNQGKRYNSRILIQTILSVCLKHDTFVFCLCPTARRHALVLSPSLSELLADGMLSSRSGMLSSVARSSLCTTIFNLPFDLSISFLASISDRFSVTVPLICQSQRSGSGEEVTRRVVFTVRGMDFTTLHLL